MDTVLIGVLFAQIWLIAGLIVGLAAKVDKNRSFIAWFILGMLFSIVMLIPLLLVRKKATKQDKTKSVNYGSSRELDEAELREIDEIARTINPSGV